MALYKFDFMLCYVNANRRHTLLMHSITGGCRYISNYQEWTGVKRERGGITCSALLMQVGSSGMTGNMYSSG